MITSLSCAARSPRQAPRLIGVSGASAATERPARLLGALEEAFPVEFTNRDEGDVTGLDGLLVLDSQGSRWLEGLALSRASCPTLVTLGHAGGPATDMHRRVDLADDPWLATPLKGRTLTELSPPTPFDGGPGEGDRVLASIGLEPVWWRSPESAWRQVSRFAPEELGEEDALRDRLCAGRFMGLLPLVHLLAHVCRESAWEQGPLRASFVIDDPNLHSSSYGFLNYAEMVADAERHDYHVGLAMVPLDGWMASPRAASLVRERPRALSLLVHGNDHLASELARLTDEREAEEVLAQALRRIAKFERRFDVAVERVMVPPHESCSRTALRTMFRLGFDGACIGRRHPWSDREPPPSPARWPLTKWRPADMVAGSLPILPRYLVGRPLEDLVFRALLRQPLILFGHHWDFAEGLGPLADAAAYIDGMGDVVWGPLGWIARNNFLNRRDGRTLSVELHSRGALVEIPDGVDSLCVSTPCAWDDRSSRTLSHGSGHTAMVQSEGMWRVEHLQVRAGERVPLALVPDRPLDPDSVKDRGLSSWAALRRTLVEGRDRVQPLARRVAGAYARR